VGQTLRQLHPRPPLHICDAGGNLDVIYYAAERKSYGTREDKKTGGDASSSACGYGGQGSCSARRRACGRRARTVKFRSLVLSFCPAAPAVGLDNVVPDRAKYLKRFQPPEPPTAFLLLLALPPHLYKSGGWR